MGATVPVLKYDCKMSLVGILKYYFNLTFAGDVMDNISGRLLSLLWLRRCIHKARTGNWSTLMADTKEVAECKGDQADRLASLHGLTLQVVSAIVDGGAILSLIWRSEHYNIDGGGDDGQSAGCTAKW